MRILWWFIPWRQAERLEPYYPPRDVNLATDTPERLRERQREVREYMRRNEQ